MRPTALALVLAVLLAPCVSAEPYLLRNIVDGDQGSRPCCFTVGDQGVFFLADSKEGTRDVWIADGGPGGVRRVRSLGERPITGNEFRPFGGLMFFAVTYGEGVHSSYGLWRSDGTRSGTFSLGTRHSEHPFRLDRAVEHRGLLFMPVGHRLWRTDGTREGTFALSTASDFRWAALGESLYFSLVDAVWRTDGTRAGTQALWEAGSPDHPRGVHSLAALGGSLFFVSETPSGSGLWTSDGTAAGTRRIADLGTSQVSALHVAGGRLYFVVKTASDDLLWLSDGTEEGTAPATALVRSGPGPVRDRIRSVHELGGQVYLGMGGQVVRSNGTLGGTSVLPYLPPFFDGATAGELLFFESAGLLWRSDGTEAGTFPLSPLSTLSAFPRPFVIIPDGVAFVTEMQGGQQGGHLEEIRVSDGTLEGTRTVATLGGMFPIRDLTATGEGLLFASWEGGHGSEPWAMPIWDLFTEEPSVLRVGDFGRFRVEVEWSDGTRTGRGQVVPQRSVDSGLFWFFADENWELLVKVLDACSYDERFWVFSAATTNVEYTLTVTDTATGDVRRYENPLGQPAVPIVDTNAFATCATPPAAGAAAAGAAAAVASTPSATVSSKTASSKAVSSKTVCADGAGLCLGEGGRYRLTVTWSDGVRQGSGVPVPGSTDSGLFWFFGADNWEILVKVLDACVISDHRWVFAAATTTVEFELTVEDTVTGVARRYHNPLGQVAETVTDTAAFRCE